MIPLRDNIPSSTTPIVNYVMIALCSLVFIAQLRDGSDGTLVERYGMIPARVLDPDRSILVPHDELIPISRYEAVRRVVNRPAEPPGVPAWLTLLTCIFLHGGWMHFLGNMWFLYIFGDNVEDRFGHGGYALFYLGTGMVASLTHLMTGPESMIPTIGASGAIAGVMGAYFLLYPRAQVLTLVPILFLVQILVIPAPVFLGIWFLIQFYQGAFAVGSVQSAGVAWWAHIGGFLAGLLLAWLLQRAHRLRPRPVGVDPGAARMIGFRHDWRRRPPGF